MRFLILNTDYPEFLLLSGDPLDAWLRLGDDH